MKNIRLQPLVIFIIGVLLAVSVAFSEPYFRLHTEDDWQKALLSGQVQAMTQSQWDMYMAQLREYQQQGEGEPYPDTAFSPPELSVYGGGSGANGPSGPGLVMAWGGATPMPQGIASAFIYDYGMDPDLSNSTITITVTAPQFDKFGNQITIVSFGIQDINGNIRAWYWNVGPGPGGIAWNVPTTITINTALVGLAATNPTANGYVSNPAFDITKAQLFIVDENCQWVGGSTPIPPPGQTVLRPWNYWHDLTVTPNGPNGGLPVGINIDVHQDIQGAYPNDFHIEGRIESGLPGGNWSKPPTLIKHIDGVFPNFSYTIQPDTADPGQNWYIINANWSITGNGIPYCTVMHLGLEFNVTCHNIIIDLKGWWTLNGVRITTGPINIHSGFVPIPGFDVQDNILLAPSQGNTQRMRMQNGNLSTPHDIWEIPIEIVQLQLVSVTPLQLTSLLGSDPFSELRTGGLEQILPWIPVVNQNGPVSENNPIAMAADSFFDVFFDPAVSGGPHPLQPINLNPGDFLIARERIRFTNNSNLPEYRWVWEIHKAHDQESDLGDAPDSSNSFGVNMTAYPWGVQANFPTVYLAGSPPNGPIHLAPQQVAHLGRAVTREREADIGFDQDPTNNIIPPKNLANLDLADDGVLGLPLKLPPCKPTRFKYLVNVINPTVNLYVNVWFDWNRDGDWDDTLQCSDGSLVPERAVTDQLIAAGSLPVGLNTVLTPLFKSWHPVNATFNMPIWMRITLSEQPWTGSGPVTMLGNGGSGPVGGYQFGETEDYIFIPRTGRYPNPDINVDGTVNLLDFVVIAQWWLAQPPDDSQIVP